MKKIIFLLVLLIGCSKSKNNEFNINLKISGQTNGNSYSTNISYNQLKTIIKKLNIKKSNYTSQTSINNPFYLQKEYPPNKILISKIKKVLNKYIQEISFSSSTAKLHYSEGVFTTSWIQVGKLVSIKIIIYILEDVYNIDVWQKTIFIKPHKSKRTAKIEIILHKKIAKLVNK